MTRPLRLVVATALLACAAVAATAQVWAPIARVSSTLGNDARHICIGGTADFHGCPAHAPYVSSSGLVGIGTSHPNAHLDVHGTVSATYLRLSSPTTVVGCNAGLTGSMRYTSGTMQVCDGTAWGNIGIGVPAGTISAFAAASCPSGWVEYGPARGRFLRGIDNGAGNDPDGTRAPGNVQADMLAAHTHGLPGSLLHNSAPADFSSQGGGSADYRRNENTGHTTTSSGGTETRPKNVAVIFCSYAGYQSEVVPGISTLGGLSDVSIGGASTGQVLAFDGATWVASNTTASNALGDRITSGTHAVTVNTASGVVSLSAAGTTWGYLSSGNSYLPILVAGRVSSTNISGTLIQAGSSTAACDAGLAGGIRYNAVSNTLQVCTGTTGWKSLTSGTAVSSLATLTDVNITNLAGRDYLRYDHATSRWVNISESTVMSTTTMINAWPDAIMCTNSADTSAVLLMVHSLRGSDNTHYYYYPGSTSYYARFNGDGSYNAGGYQTTAGPHPCQHRTITQLYANGQAFNFIGNGGTGSGDALGDRITSGTHAVTANSATGIVSLSTAGTTWGYLSSGNSYLPLLASGRVSSTNISGTLIQAGASTAACNAGLAGGIRYNAVSNTLQVCTGTTGWKSLTSGTAVSSLGALTDVNITNLAGRDYLRYDSVTSRWVNISESTVMSTTTMVQNRPDAIICGNSTYTDQVTVLVLSFRRGSSDSPSNAILYQGLSSAGINVQFDANDNYINSGGNIASTGPIPCVGKSLAQLYADGQAFNFIGNSGANGGAALGDRITSGTLPHAVTMNSATGIVSLSTAGTTWGYLSSGNSYLPLLASGRVSSTNISGTLIQAGASTAACDAGLAGGIRYNAVSNTLQVCTGTTGWKSLTSGTAVSSLGALTDVNLTNLADRDYLRYDSVTSRWVNISESTVMSTTTMVSGWPDAIRCVMSGNNAVTLYLGNSPNSSNLYFYFYPGEARNVAFNASGAYSSHSGMADADCVAGAKSISTLYSEGKAFNFIGNSGANDSRGDRLVSGTLPHAVTVNSATGVVSLSSGVTTWGYLGSANSYLPLVSSARVSSTNISATTIHAAGNVQAFSFLHPSDERLKADITSIPNAAAILESLRGTHFTWKSNGSFSYGLIAQEVEKVMPSAVHGTDSKVVDYNQFIAVLVEGWKTHHQSIKVLESEVRALRADNDNYKKAIEGLEQRLRRLEAGGVAQ